MSDIQKHGDQPEESRSEPQLERTSTRRSVLAGALVGAFSASYAAGSGSARAMALYPRRRRRRRGGGIHCFLKGTMIQTPEGERHIESLKIGDLVTTASGASKPVKWVGRWTAKRRAGQDWDWEVVPVRIARGALDGVSPHQDLFVTDEHCLFLDGVLIPAIDLVNGVSIAKNPSPAEQSLAYFHVELHDHDVVVANGAKAETLTAEAGERQNFENFDEYVSHYGAEPATVPTCAPVIGNNTRLKELKSKVRCAFAPLYDRRQPHEIVHQRLAERAMQQAA